MANGAILGQTVEIPQPVNTVASDNMNAVTSNAVYQALQNLPAGVQIATGSYTGTGTYGASNPNSLTFEFEPKLVIIIKKSGGGAFYSLIAIRGQEQGIVVTSGSAYIFNILTWNGLDFQFYCTYDAQFQLNENGAEYLYLIAS